MPSGDAPEASVVSNRPLAIARVLYIMGVAVCSWDRLAAPEFSGFHFKLAYLLLLAATVVGLFDNSRGNALGPPLTPGRTRMAGFLRPLFAAPFVWFSLFTLWCFALIAVSPVAKKTLGYSLWGSFELICFACAGIWLFARGRTDDVVWRRRLVNGWIAGAVLISLVAVVDFAAFFLGAREGLIGGLQPIAMTFREGGLPRSEAFSYEPSYLALTLCFAESILFARLVAAPSPRRAEWAAFGILALGLTAAYSRSGFLLIAAAAAVASLLLRGRIRLRRLGIVAAFGVLLASGAVLATPSSARSAIFENFFSSLATGRDASMQGRAYVFREGLRIASGNWLGTGSGSAMHRYLANLDRGRSLGAYPQNATPVMSLWPEIAMEEGAIGLAFFVAFLVTLAVALGRNPSIDARGTLAALVSVGVIGLFFYPTAWRADLWSLFAVAGILGAPHARAYAAANAEE